MQPNCKLAYVSNCTYITANYSCLSKLLELTSHCLDFISKIHYNFVCDIVITAQYTRKYGDQIQNSIHQHDNILKDKYTLKHNLNILTQILFKTVGPHHVLMTTCQIYLRFNLIISSLHSKPSALSPN